MQDLEQQKKDIEKELIDLNQKKIKLLNELSDIKTQFPDEDDWQKKALHTKKKLDERQHLLNQREEAITEREINIEFTLGQARDAIIRMKGLA